MVLQFSCNFPAFFCISLATFRIFPAIFRDWIRPSLTTIQRQWLVLLLSKVIGADAHWTLYAHHKENQHVIHHT